MIQNDEPLMKMDGSKISLVRREFIHVWVNVVDVDIVVISMTKKIHSYFIVPKSNWADMMDKNGL